MSTDSVDIKNGRVFPEPFRFYLIAAIVIAASIVQGDYRGFVFLVIPLLGITAVRGTQFSSQKYRRYFAVAGLKFGTWEKYQPGEALVLIGLEMSTRYFSYSGLISAKEGKKWVLYIVNAQHRNKRDVGIAAKKEDLTQKVTLLEEVSPLKLVPYAPTISAQSRERKRR